MSVGLKGSVATSRPAVFSNLTPFLVMGIRALSLLVGMVTTFLVARALGPDGFGQYAYALAVTGIATLFTTLGVHHASARYVAQYPQSIAQVISRSYAVKILLCAGVLLAFQAFIGPSTLLFLALLLTVLTSFKDFQIQLLSSGLKIRTVAYLSLGMSFVRLGSVALVMLQPQPSVEALFVVNIFSMTFSITLTAWLIARWMQESDGGTAPLRPDEGFKTRQLLLYALPLFAIALMDYLFFETGTIFVKHYQGMGEAGLFSAVMSLSNKAPVFSVMLANVYAPFIGKLFHQQADLALIRQATRHAILMNLLLIVPAALLCGVMAPEVVAILFGAKFSAAVPMLQVLSLYLFFHCFFAPLAMIAGYLGLAARRVAFLLPLAGLYLLLNFWLIPTGGGVAAAGILTLVHLLETAWFVGLIREHCGVSRRELAVLIGKLTAMAALSLLPAWGLAKPLFVEPLPRLVAVILLATPGYLGLLFWTGTVNRRFFTTRWHDVPAKAS